MTTFLSEFSGSKAVQVVLILAFMVLFTHLVIDVREQGYDQGYRVGLTEEIPDPMIQACSYLVYSQRMNIPGVPGLNISLGELNVTNQST